MFTGIVEECGSVQRIEDLGDSARITIAARTVMDDCHHGDSIAVNGVCLTVTDFAVPGDAASHGDSELGSTMQDADGWFQADVMQETLRRSALGALREGSMVNLERAARVDSRLSGHIVQGHVDTTATLLSRSPGSHWDVFRFTLPDSIARYVVSKGSIAVSGTSLTVSAVGPDFFEVSLIPVTLAETILGQLQPGDAVNVEVDVLGKYVERLLAFRPDIPDTRG